MTSTHNIDSDCYVTIDGFSLLVSYWSFSFLDKRKRKHSVV